MGIYRVQVGLFDKGGILMSDLVNQMMKAAKRYSVADYAVIKITLLTAGILIGASAPQVFSRHKAPLLTVFASSYAWIVYRTFCVHRRWSTPPKPNLAVTHRERISALISGYPLSMWSLYCPQHCVQQQLDSLILCCFSGVWVSKKNNRQLWPVIYAYEILIAPSLLKLLHDLKLWETYH